MYSTLQLSGLISVAVIRSLLKGTRGGKSLFGLYVLIDLFQSSSSSCVSDPQFSESFATV